MRALIQRATKASVQVADKVAGQIDQLLLIRICSMDGDGESEVKKLAVKIIKLQVFADESRKVNRALNDIAG